VKHLIYLVDGTWISAIDTNFRHRISNVFKLGLALSAKDTRRQSQVVFYFSGVGAPGRGEPITAGGFARGIDHLVSEVYLNVCANYDDGDAIYLFGYSRGAVVARAVSGIISKFGLLYPSKINWFSNVWSAFCGGQQLSDSEKSIHLYPAKVRFLGAFDTVFGGSNEKNMFHNLRFTDRNLEACVENAVHIIGLDEERGRFSPLLWDKFTRRQFIQQIWMPGTHGDIGGEHKEGNFFGDLALMTMLDRLNERVPEIGLQADFLTDLRSSISSSLSSLQNVSIHQEWNLKWKLIHLFRRSKRVPKPDVDASQLQHPIVGILSSEKITVRGRREQIVKWPVEKLNVFRPGTLHGRLF